MPISAGARINLPQTRQAVTLREDAARAARAFFSVRNATPDLAGPVEKSLVESLPTDFRRGCDDVMESWGSAVAGSGQWRVRLLYQQPKRVWLAFRCGASRKDLSQYYDERLGVLSLNTGRLEFLPLGEDAENDSTLYRIEFAERLALEGTESLTFRVKSSNDNPCCGGPEAISEEKLMAFVNTPEGVREALSVLTRREHDSHDDVDGDTQTTYNAQAKFERDSQGRVTSVVAAFSEEDKDVTWNGASPQYHSREKRTGTLRYTWNPARFHFEEMK